jgi:hypothetical protein
MSILSCDKVIKKNKYFIPLSSEFVKSDSEISVQRTINDVHVIFEYIYFYLYTITIPGSFFKAFKT